LLYTCRLACCSSHTAQDRLGTASLKTNDIVPSSSGPSGTCHPGRNLEAAAIAIFILISSPEPIFENIDADAMLRSHRLVGGGTGVNKYVTVDTLAAVGPACAPRLAYLWVMSFSSGDIDRGRHARGRKGYVMLCASRRSAQGIPPARPCCGHIPRAVQIKTAHLPPNGCAVLDPSREQSRY